MKHDMKVSPSWDAWDGRRWTFSRIVPVMVRVPELPRRETPRGRFQRPRIDPRSYIHHIQ